MLNKRVALEDEFAKSLKEYGFDRGSCVLRVSFKNADGSSLTSSENNSKEKVSSNSNTQSASDGENPDIKAREDEKNGTLKEITTPQQQQQQQQQPSYEIYKPAKDSKNPAIAAEIANDYDDDDGDHELSIEEAKRYQELLKSKADAKSDYVKQKLKQEAERKKLLATKNESEPVKDIQFRIKFPDQSITQLKFKSNNTVQDLVDFINNELLIKQDLKYNLVIPKFNYTNAHRGKQRNSTAGKKDDNVYHKDIATANNEVLKRSLAEYGQVSFIFELLQDDGKVNNIYKGPFLKNSEKAQNIEKLIHQTDNYNDGATAGKSEPPAKKKLFGSSSSSGSGSGSSSGEKKVPKWLKLGKK